MKPYPVPLIAGALLVAVLASCTGSGPTSVTLHVIEHATTDTVADLAPEGDSAGDVLTFANEVFDEANQKKVGDDNGYCLRTAVGKAWECVWTLTLADGQITVEGPFYDTADSALAITGGAGAYREARGQMSLHARNAEGSEYDFVYEIIR